jgi:hypothetical protein
VEFSTANGGIEMAKLLTPLIVGSILWACLSLAAGAAPKHNSNWLIQLLDDTLEQSRPPDPETPPDPNRPCAWDCYRGIHVPTSEERWNTPLGENAPPPSYYAAREKAARDLAHRAMAPREKDYGVRPMPAPAAAPAPPLNDALWNSAPPMGVLK